MLLLNVVGAVPTEKIISVQSVFKEYIISDFCFLLINTKSMTHQCSWSFKTLGFSFRQPFEITHIYRESMKIFPQFTDRVFLMQI